MKIIWLASWYPHPGNPYEGDFIQRHAKALSKFSDLTVFYVSQDGIDNEVEYDQTIENEYNGIREKIIFFRFKKSGIAILDKIIYNLRYYQTYKKSIRQYIDKNGKPDIIHVHVPIKAGMIGRWIKRKWGVPYIVSEHSSHYNENTDDSFYSKSIRYRYNVKKIFKEAKIVTNVSAAIGNRIKMLFDLKDIRVIRNTVDTNLFYYSDQKLSKFRFIHVSTLAEYQKNITGILNAVTSLSKQRQGFEFVFVGPATGELRQNVNSKGLSGIIKFTGEISYPEVALQTQQASALVLFSRYENFPCVIIEALCCGLPVIATDTGGIREASNEENGIMIQSENEEQLLNAMNRVINEYEKYDRRKIAEQGKKEYSYETIGRSFYDLYTEVTGYR